MRQFIAPGRPMRWACAGPKWKMKAAIDCTLTSDQREAFTAFLEKRAPEWSNS